MMQEEWISRGQEVIMNTYRHFPLVFERGEGCCLFDTQGKRYLDFVAGVAVNSLGYKNSKYICNLATQLQKLNHCSNLYWNIPQIKLAEILIRNSHFDKVFFCNSGAEAVEAAIKLSRKYAKKAHGSECYEIISMKQSFHGRTLGAVTLTGQEKYHKGFEPLLPGVNYVPYNDFQALKEQISEKTCAVIIEPIQGEGGIRPADRQFLQSVRDLCSEKDILLIFDEVQCGIGRTGKLFAYEIFDVKPDIITLAKGLGNGFPIGAMMAMDSAAQAFEPGDHASTFGGNPLAAVAGLTVLTQLLEKNLLEKVERQGKYLRKKLIELREKYKIITDVRGIGLMQGIELSIPVETIINKCIDHGLLLIGAGSNVIRFVPPLIITKKEIDEGMGILSDAIREVENEG